MSDERKKQLDLIVEKLKPIPLPPLPENPLVSVLTANYNYARFLGEAIESVQRQTYTNWEMIICDDGSTDNSCEVVERYARRDSRIKLIRKENGGMASALNAAYEESKGEIISTLDADDIWFPERIEAVLAAFRSSGSGAVFHSLRMVDSRGRTLKDRLPRRPSRGWLGPALLRGQPVWFAHSSGWSIRRRVANLVFPLPVAFRSMADMIVSRRTALLTPIESLPRSYGLYRLHGGNLTGYGATTVERLDEGVSILREALEDGARFVHRICGLTVEPREWERPELAQLLLRKRCSRGRRCGLGSCPSRLQGLCAWPGWRFRSSRGP